MTASQPARRTPPSRSLALAEAPAAERDFAALYASWFEPVCRWARALGGPRSDLEDVAQEVFLVVRRKLPGFVGDDVGGWLYRITAGKVRDARRRAWVRRLLFGEAPPDRASEQPGPADQLERKQDERLLYQLLDRLSDKRRRALVLAEIEGLSGEEIARLEGIPLATARTRLFYARQEFLTLVEAHALGGRR